MLAVGRVLGHLRKYKNWVPERSIYILSWDGEEYGLLGKYINK